MAHFFPIKEYSFTVPHTDWDKLNNGKLDHQLYAKSALLKEVNFQDKVYFYSSSFLSKSPILIFQNGEKELRQRL